jgi:1-deoxy-D-xylulose-5-phosphate synthase
MVAGGFGSAVLELLEAHGLLQQVNLRMVGFPDRPVEHGAPSILKELYGLTSSHIKDVVRDMLAAAGATENYKLAH